MSLTNVKTRHKAGFTLVEVVVSVALSAVVFAAILSGFTFLGRNLTRLVHTQDQEARARRAVNVFTQDINSAIEVYSSTVPSPSDPQGKAALKLVLPALSGGIPPAAPFVGQRSGRIEAFTSNTINDVNAGWSTNKLVSPAAPWFVRITSGSFSGKLLPITSNTATSVTITGTDLTTLGLVAGKDTFELATIVSYIYSPATEADPSAGSLTRYPFDRSLAGTDETGAAVLLKNLNALGFRYFNKAGDAVSSGLVSIKEVELVFTSALGDLNSGTQSRYAVVSPRVVLRNKALLQ